MRLRVVSCWLLAVSRSTVKMEIEIDEEFKSICRQIFAKGRGEEEWAEVESGDMFQTVHHCGGFEQLRELFVLATLIMTHRSFGFKFL